jgi:HK97 family phage major capsid protein
MNKTALALKAELATVTNEHRSALAAIIANPESTPDIAAIEARVQATTAQLEARNKLDAYDRIAPAISQGETRDRSNLAASFNFGEAVSDHTEGREMRGAAGEWNQENRSKRAGGFSAPVEMFLGGVETRALTTAAPAGGPGGNLIQTTLGPMIERLRPVMAVEAMGATIIGGLTGNLDLPRQKTSGTATWVNEHVNSTRSDPTFDKVSLAPNTVTAEYEVSRRMLLQATQLDSILRRDLALLLAEALDLAAIAGTGAEQPMGILNTAGIFTHPGAVNGKALDLDLAPDLIGALDSANVMGGRGFLTNAKVRKAAMKLRDGQGQPYGVGSVFGAEPVSFSNQMPGNITKGTGTNLSALIYANWADLIVAYWSSVDIVLNPFHADVASKGGVLMHAFLDADIAVRNVASFAVAKDVIAP